MSRELVDKVWSFLDKTAAAVGQMEINDFSHQMHANCLEKGMESPIEDLFWIACHALCRSESVAINPGPEVLPSGDIFFFDCVQLEPQKLIGTYRVDFLLSWGRTDEQQSCAPVVIELDGHAFHDKNKRQRSYEKARDRFLVKQGYRVLHFTGSDVVADPFKVASEALELVGLFSYSNEYNPADPLGRGI